MQVGINWIFCFGSQTIRLHGKYNHLGKYHTELIAMLWFGSPETEGDGARVHANAIQEMMVLFAWWVKRLTMPPFRSNWILIAPKYSAMLKINLHIDLGSSSYWDLHIPHPATPYHHHPCSIFFGVTWVILIDSVKHSHIKLSRE